MAPRWEPEKDSGLGGCISLVKDDLSIGRFAAGISPCTTFISVSASHHTFNITVSPRSALHRDPDASGPFQAVFPEPEARRLIIQAYLQGCTVRSVLLGLRNIDILNVRFWHKAGGNTAYFVRYERKADVVLLVSLNSSSVPLLPGDFPKLRIQKTAHMLFLNSFDKPHSATD